MRSGTVRPPVQKNWWDATDADPDESDSEHLLVERKAFPKPTLRPEGHVKCYHYIVISFLLVVMVSYAVVSYFVFETVVLAQRTEETCTVRPVGDYLLAAGVHAAVAALTLLAYALCLELDMRHSGRPAHLHSFQKDSTFGLFVVEALLVLLALTQVALAVLGEVWSGALGIMKRPSALLCSKTAPLSWSMLRRCGLYESWIVVFAAIVLLTLLCAACVDAPSGGGGSRSDPTSISTVESSSRPGTAELPATAESKRGADGRQ